MKHVLEADGIYLSLNGRSILSSIYLRCETGRVTGLLGRNGEGKSCLMNVIYGRMAADSKSVRLNGAPFLDGWRQSRRLRFAPQFHFVPDAYTLKRVFNDFNVDFDGFCDWFPELEHFYRARMSHLSGGHKRLVEIYVILCSATDFVMLDEPFSHIMPVHVEQLQEVIRQEKVAKGILISDHLYREVVKVSDELYVLEGGHLKGVSRLEELVARGYVRNLP